MSAREVHSGILLNCDFCKAPYTAPGYNIINAIARAEYEGWQTAGTSIYCPHCKDVRAEVMRRIRLERQDRPKRSWWARLWKR